MINATEVLVYRTADDEAGRGRLKAELYRPPRNHPRASPRRTRGFDLASARRMMADLEAYDTEVTSR